MKSKIMMMALVAIVISSLTPICFASQSDQLSLSSEQEKRDHYLSRNGDEDSNILKKENQMLLERLIKAEERLANAESDINSLKMN